MLKKIPMCHSSPQSFRRGRRMYLNLTDSIWFPKYCMLDAMCVQWPHRSCGEVQTWSFSRRSHSNDTTGIKSVMRLNCLFICTLGNQRTDLLQFTIQPLPSLLEDQQEKKSEKKALRIVFNRLSLFMRSNSSRRRQLVHHLLVKILWCCCCCDQTNYFVLFKKKKGGRGLCAHQHMD